MSTTLALSTTQRQILERAIGDREGRLVWFPQTLRGRARQNLLDGLLARSLIRSEGTQWYVAADGYAALGHRTPCDLSTTPRVRTRANTKQAHLIALLQRPQGATVNQMCEATGWQPHTVRGTLARTVKKQLQLTLVSEKSQGGERVYRVADPALLP